MFTYYLCCVFLLLVFNAFPERVVFSLVASPTRLKPLQKVFFHTIAFCVCVCVFLRLTFCDIILQASQNQPLVTNDIRTKVGVFPILHLRN